jgi:tRNA nucleotidyltransferase/poly(A) polymerase
MDFVMGETPTSLAKKLAKRLKAGFFVLDDERNTARVVHHDHHGRYFPLDFVQFTGRDLDEDLRNRDFTINAMAVPVNALTQLIDPLGGQTDLAQKVLRACSDHALSDDPVRVLRGVRLAVQFGFKYAPGLEAAMQAAAKLLPNTSNERQRDEFFRLIAGPDPALGLQHCQRLQVFDTLIPPLVELESLTASPDHQPSLLDHAIKTVQQYGQLLGVLTTREVQQSTHPSRMQEAVSVLGPFSGQIGAYFNQELTPGRSIATLAFLGALLQEVGRPRMGKTGQDVQPDKDQLALVNAAVAHQIAKQLPLSNAESGWVQTLVQHHLHLLPLINACSVPDRRTVYRFFRSTGDVGVAIVLHSLADILAAEDPDIDPERWACSLQVATTCLSAWWEDQENIVTPQPLLDGNDLQQEFGLAPGKVIGRLLNQLVEEQASGTVANLDQARDFIKNRLSDYLKLGENHEN